MRVVLLGFDAMDPEIVRAMAAEGRLPAFAALLESGATCPVRNPVGLFVGTLWSTFFTARSAARTGFHCWEEIVPGSYERRLTTADSIQGTPFWETVSDAGRRVAVLDVPHSRAGTRLNGVQVSEWGCHDRHFGLRSFPPQRAKAIVERFGLHPVLGADPWSVREWAPDDYVFRNGSCRSGAEEEQLLRGLLQGVQAKARLSAELLAEEPWDVFISVFGESHSVGHQSWHVRDQAHPRHDPALRARIGDPIAQVYERLDAALGRHLELLEDEDAVVLALLSHGIGPHHDGTHLLPEILRRLDAAYRGEAVRRPRREVARRVPMRLLAAALRRRLRDHELGEARDDETAQERRRQLFFRSPNNFVVGGIRLNVSGRERSGIVKPGAEFDELCQRLRADLMALVNVETGRQVIRDVERTDTYYERAELDALPDLLIEWNHDAPIETVWSPRFGVIRGSYVHWRTGDHRPGGLLLARGPGVEPGAELPEIAIEDLAPSIAARLGVVLEDVDGAVVPWLSGDGFRGAGGQPAAPSTAVR
jgi:predicted AlkP superfamily phosphohydrolase/phosphomutase